MDQSETRAGYFQKLSGYLTDLCSGILICRGFLVITNHKGGSTGIGLVLSRVNRPPSALTGCTVY